MAARILSISGSRGKFEFKWRTPLRSVRGLRGRVPRSESGTLFLFAHEQQRRNPSSVAVLRRMEDAKGCNHEWTRIHTNGNRQRSTTKTQRRKVIFRLPRS